MTTITGGILNCLDKAYNGRFYVAQYNELPKNWSSIGTLTTSNSADAAGYRKINNDSTAKYFDGTYKYLVIVVYPSDGDLNGTAIAFDQIEFLKQFAQDGTASGYDANVLLRVCSSFSNNTFTFNTMDANGNQTTHTQAVGAPGESNRMYCSLDMFSVTSVGDTVTAGMFPYIIGSKTGSVTFGAPDASGNVQIVKPNRGVIVKIYHPLSYMTWILVLLVIFVVAIGIMYGIYHYYKKRKPMMQ